MCPRQPARCRAWQRSQIPWPGPRPQVHLRIPGAVTLLPAFHRARAATRHQIRNKGKTVARILFARQMQRCFVFETTKFCSLQRIPCVFPNTPCPLLFLLPPWLITCCPLSYQPSLIMPQRKKQEKNTSPPKPQHAVGKPDVYIGFLGTCMEKSLDGQGLHVIPSRPFLPWVQNYQWCKASLKPLCAREG